MTTTPPAAARKIRRRFMIERCEAAIVHLPLFGQLAGVAKWNLRLTQLIGDEYRPPLTNASRFRVKRAFAQLWAESFVRDHVAPLVRSLVDEVEHTRKKLDESLRLSVVSLHNSHTQSGEYLRRLERLQDEIWFVGAIVGHFGFVTGECVEQGQGWGLPRNLVAKLKRFHGRFCSELWEPLAGQRLVIEGMVLNSYPAQATIPKIPHGLLRRLPSLSRHGPSRLPGRDPWTWNQLAAREPESSDAASPEVEGGSAEESIGPSCAWPDWQRPVLGINQPESKWGVLELKDELRRAYRLCPHLKWLWRWWCDWWSQTGSVESGSELVVQLWTNPDALFQLWTEVELRDRIKSLPGSTRWFDLLTRSYKGPNPLEPAIPYYNLEWKEVPQGFRQRGQGDIPPVWPHWILTYKESDQRQSQRWISVHCVPELDREDALRNAILAVRSFNALQGWDQGILLVGEVPTPEMIEVAGLREGTSGIPAWSLGANRSGECEVEVLQVVPTEEAQSHNRAVLDAIVERMAGARPMPGP